MTDLDRIIDVSYHIARGLTSAHVLHADVKPSDVLIQEVCRLASIPSHVFDILVIDFGVAVSNETNNVSGGAEVNDSPEQQRGQDFVELTPKTDSWNLAITMVEMFARAKDPNKESKIIQ